MSIDMQWLRKNYPKLDEFYSNAIEYIFSNSREIEASEIIVDDSNNNLSALDEFKGKVGVYLFYTEDGIKYIGKGGTSEKATKNAKDLRYRISQELCEYIGNNQNTLSKNIIDIESILMNENISSKDSLDYIKNMKLRVFSAGERLEGNKVNLNLIRKVESLELLLIALLPSKYNK